MPYANNYSRRERRRSRAEEDFVGRISGGSTKSGAALMPPEPLPPWDRKGEFFRERRHGYGHGHGYEHGHHHHHNNNNIGGGGGGGPGGGGGRWRDSPSSPFASGSRNSNEFSPRWGFPSSEFRRPPGHGKQGGWHLYQEESPHGYSTPRSGDRFLDEDSFRPSGQRGDGRYGRFHRENRNGFAQKEWRGHSWENNHQYSGPANTPGRSHIINDQRSVGNSPARPSLPNSDPSAQLNSKDANKTVETNVSSVSQRLGKENSLGSLDWKPLKWSRSGSLTSRGSGFSHSSSSKSTGGESSDVKGDLAPKNVTPVQSPSGDVGACDPSSGDVAACDPSRKKPRLGWGEGLAKYEKKKVDPEDNVRKMENTGSVGHVEQPTHSVSSSLADKSPKITGFSDCSSPTTPSSFACSSSPGLEEKSYGKTTDGDPNNFSVSSMPVPENLPEGMQFSLEKLELDSITNLSSLLNELLHVDDQCSMDSGFMRSSAFNKLLLWKGDISKALELTETEIDSLENELKLLKADSVQGVICPGPSNVSPEDGKDCQNGFTRPVPLDVVSSEDIIMENAHPSRCATAAGDIDSPGTATSKFVESLPAQKLVSPCKWSNSCSADEEFVNSSTIVPENGETTGGTSHQGDDANDFKDTVVAMVEHAAVPDKNEASICDIILASNRDTAAKASEVLHKLLPADNSVVGIEAIRLSCLSADTTVKEKFSRRKRSLKFKERVISMKYRAFHHLWKEDLRLLSLRSHRTKPQKKLELSSRTMQNGNQKHRSSIRSRFASPAGSLSLVPTTEILNFTSKLLSDSEAKIYRSSLKMPAMILDEKEKVSSRFVSSNGLVEDPCGVEKERALTNPWTNDEKEIFMEKLATFGKEFTKIASFLDHKTTADCIQFYYKNHKSECFDKTKKLDVKKQLKPLSSDTYMLTSGKKWGRDMNAASLDVLGAASVIAAQADQAMKTSKLVSGKSSNNKKSRGCDAFIETVSNFFIEDERETAAADVLAGICGSLSSEAMSSCITSSVDPADGNHELRHQKFGASARRPLTPDVTQNVDDNSCSDESCGEMDAVDWTDDEKSLFVQAFASHGKDFLMISRVVRTKTRDQCKVFFSKARKCLGLETLHPGSCSGGVLGSSETNGGGSDIEDACVAETGSVSCSDKSGSRMDEDFPHTSQDVSKPDSTVADLTISDGNCVLGQMDCNDIDVEPEGLCTGDNQGDVSDLGPGGVVDVQDKKSADDIQERAYLVARNDTSLPAIEGTTGVSPTVLDPVSVSVFEATNGKSVATCENRNSHLSNSACFTERQCEQSTRFGSSLGSQGANKDLKSSPLNLSVKADMNSAITHKPGSESRVQSFHEFYFRKCSRLASQSAAELPLLPKSEARTNDHAMVGRSSGTEKPCSSAGDVKLFGKILSKPSSSDKATSSVQCDDGKSNRHLTSGSKINMKLAASSDADGNSALAKHDHNGLAGLENVPVRTYGIWDGSKIQVGYPSLTESSALLLARYPAAFANCSISSPATEQQSLQVAVNSDECNINNACEFSPTEFSSGNGVPPFTLDIKPRRSVTLPGVQRNGFEALSSLQPNGKDFVKLNVVQGEFHGGVCTGVSDPVGWQYSGQQYGGRVVNGAVREDSWGGEGGVGR